MKKFLYLLFILFTGFTVSDRQKEIRNIQWNNDLVLQSNDISRKVYSFSKAEYADPKTCLPWFVENFQIDGDVEFMIEPVNLRFESLKVEKDVYGTGFVGDQLVYKSSVVKTAGQKILQFQLLPLIKEGDTLKRLVSFEIRRIPHHSQKNSTAQYPWKSESVLKTGKWVKIKTLKRGIYKITYDKLKQWGFNDPSRVSLFANSGYVLPESNASVLVDDLVQYRIWFGKDNQGKDCLFFYSSGSLKWDFNDKTGFFEHTNNIYTISQSFFLTENAGNSRLVESFPAITAQPGKTVNTFDEYALYEQETTNLIHSGKRWFGERFIPGSTRSVTFDIINRDPDSRIKLVLAAAARGSANSSMDISSGGNVNLGKVDFSAVYTNDPTSLYADDKKVNLEVNPSGNTFTLNLAFNSASSSAEAWFDYALINYRKKLRLEGNELFFRDRSSVGMGVIAEFSIENTLNSKVFDITNPSDIAEVPAALSGNILKFKRPSDNLREYIVFNPAGTFPEPDFVSNVANQNLHGLQNGDMLIITHSSFFNYAKELSEFHKNADGLSVNLVLTDEIYNEFGSGNPDVTSIRNFIKMLYSRNSKLKYVLLFGDGSYDNRNIGGKNKNFIPTYQSDNSLDPVSSFVTDDYFSLLDDGETVYEGAEDLGVGRLPVSNDYEAQVVLSKIKDYYSEKALGSWRNSICFIGDDEDGNLHMDDSEHLADLVNSQHKEFLTEKIYFDSFVQQSTPGGEKYPGVTAAINQKVKDGVLILNYIGHANERYMAEERVLDVSSINSWSNPYNLPIFVTATCEFSRFDGDETSAGEYILTNPSGGGIGLFSTTRLVYAYSNFILNQNFFRYVFERDQSGNRFRMGEIMRLAKVATVNTINKRNFSLLADPALRLSYPRHKVFTTGLTSNGMNSDTIGALGKITVSGYIADYLGNKLTSYQGKIIPVVYDKAVRQKTIGNAGQEQFEYKLQDNIIYKGLASVKSGNFTFSFVIPKDISYDVGKGKIAYYAFPENGTDDANGAYENFYIGGSTKNQVIDNQGPKVELYLDNETFKNGDKTSRNPLMLAFISDENGINTVGSGIGHDISAVIDNDYSNVIVLNSFYKANMDDYKSGSIEFLVENLSVGEHTLKLKVWDVANNSTEVEIKFIVTDDLIINSVSNYPNPVVDYTYITFAHNQPDESFNMILEVFDRMGRRIDLYKQKVSSSGMNSIPVRWEKSRAGTMTGNGVYVYRIIIQSTDGAIASKSGKILIAE